MNKIEFKQFLQNTKDNIQEKLNPKKIGTKISVNLKSKKTRKNLIIYAFLTLFCIAFLLLLSASTSPLYKDLCDGDSSIFIFFGKAITLGKDAYRDYFDHKGPILFYINALGYFLTKSKVGVFILQCISLSISSIFMYKTARFFTKPIRSVICVIITILAFGATISDGNLTEEYCILYCMIAIYTALKFITKHPKAPHPHKNMVIYGICFGICAFIRVNNGLIICGIVFVTIMTDFINEHIKEIFKNILYFIVGVLIVAVPVCLFFLIKGTLSDMLFSTFVFNFLYASEGSSEKTSSAILLLLQWVAPVLMMIFISSFFAKRLGPKVASFITTISIFALIPILLGFSYTHYYTTLIPLIPIYCAVFFYIASNKINILAVILCVIMAFPLANYFVQSESNIVHYSKKLYSQNHPAKTSDVYSDIYYSAKQLSSRIPDEDKDSVYCYDISATWLLQADIMPCFKIFILQEWWSEMYPEFGRQINQMMLEKQPKWVVIHNIDIVNSKQFMNIINNNYELVDEYSYDRVYKVKTQ